MDRSEFSQNVDSSTARNSLEAANIQCDVSLMQTDASRNRDRPSKSYYDLYPERKRTGPYVPKSTLLMHDSITNIRRGISESRDRVIRRSHSGSQLQNQGQESAGSAPVKHSVDAVRPPNQKSDDAGHGRPIKRSESSTYAASSIALGRARPHTITPEPVKSIDEIVRTHSSTLLTVPPSQRGPQRSVSWSAFEHAAQPSQETSEKYGPCKANLSDNESESSEGSVEQEARTILKNARDEILSSRMSQLSVGNIDPRTGSVRHDAPLRLPKKAAPMRRSSPQQLPAPESDPGSSFSMRRGLTRCVQVNVPGAPNLLVSLADVGLADGHPVMMFLGLGASRHLIGLYDELAMSLGLRLVCIDRWGIGRTDNTPLEGRSILGWSFVIEQVADLLGVDKFSILAHSAGAPFAAALALLFPHRVQGALHLLAPWTGMQQDSGYRWLRYVPDGVIKTAQAAEWKIQNWKLNKEGTKAASKAAFNPADDDIAKSRRYKTDEAHLTSTPPPGQLPRRPADLAVDQVTCDAAAHQDTAATRDAVNGSRPALLGNDEDPARAEVERSNAVALLRASHVESARGLVDDLNLVLGKRPWGFAYTDLRIGCEVWHGSRDERIPLSSSISLSKEMQNCALHIVEGASHSLMTNLKVVLEVFESIRKTHLK